jgi:HEAT repeat protein
MDLVAMLGMSREQFMDATRGSAIRRARYPSFVRNVAVALGNRGDSAAVLPLIAALEHQEPLVREHVAWALGTLGDERASQPLVRRLDVETIAPVREELVWALERLDVHLG